VLIIAHTADVSGAPKALLRLLERCVEDGYVKPAFVFAETGDLIEAFNRLGPCMNLRYPRIDRFVLRTRGGEPIRWRRTLLRWIVDAYARRHRCQVVLVNSGATFRLADLFPRRLPSVMYVHEMPSLLCRLLGQSGVNEIVGWSQHLLSVSDAVTAGLIAAGAVPDRITKLPGPVDVYRADPTDRPHVRRDALRVPDDDALVVVGCGPVGLLKGTDLFLAVARSVRDAGSTQKIVFRWIGFRQDESFAALQAELARCALGSMVEFVPGVDDAAGAIATADIFVSCSREDANPLTVLEAAAAGVPTLCFTGSGGAEELAEAGGAFAVPYLDPHAMAARVVELAEDSALRDRVGADGLSFVTANNDPGVLARRLDLMLRRAALR
jgi:glycosyltransferase involved in cell wall biosynthesis